LDETTTKASGWIAVCYCEVEANPKTLIEANGNANGNGSANGNGGSSGGGGVAAVVGSIFDFKSKSPLKSYGSSAVPVLGNGSGPNTSAPSSPTNAKTDEAFWAYLEAQEAPHALRIYSPCKLTNSPPTPIASLCSPLRDC
jgi:hypothetical protein